MVVLSRVILSGQSSCTPDIVVIVSKLAVRRHRVWGLVDLHDGRTQPHY
jgi:hypothetical protein